MGEFVRLMLPKMISHPVEPMTFLFFTSVASTMAEGSVSSVSFARNYQSAAVSIVGVGFALAAFPALSTAYAAADRRGFLRSLFGNLTTILTLTTAAAIVLFALSTFIVDFFLGGGAFDARGRGDHRADPVGLHHLDPARERDPPAEPGDLCHPPHAAAGLLVAGRLRA